MLVWLSEYLSQYYSPMSVFQYLTLRGILAVLTALIISWVFGPAVIRRLNYLQIGQAIRSDGPQSHLAKAGTPTMGGALILLALFVSTLLWADLDNRYVWIDIFAVRQWPGNMADINFRSVIEASTAMVVSVSPVKGLAEHREQTKGVCERVVFPGLLLISLPGAFIYSVYNVILNGIVYEGFLNSVSCLFLTLVCFYFFGIVFHFFRNYLCHYNRNYSLTNIMMDFGYEMQYIGCYWFFNLMQFSQKQFLETEEGKEAKKNIFFFRLWCVVEVASAVENKIPIVIKGGAAIKNEEGVYEYYRNAVGDIFYNMEDMVDIESSDCAVPEDKIREMNTIREKFGVNCNTIINGMVSSVITGARITTKDNNSSIEVDSASCGEFELLDNLYAGLEPTENQIELATKVLKAACVGGRWRVVNFLKEHWKENKHGFCKLVDSSMALSLAAKYGHIDVMRVLLETGGIDVNAGHALYMACQNNKLQAVDMLLRQDGNYTADEEANNTLIDPNQRNKITCQKQWNAKFLNETMHKKREMNCETPLSIARWRGHQEIVQRLLQHSRINNTFFYNNRLRTCFGIGVAVLLVVLIKLIADIVDVLNFL